MSGIVLRALGVKNFGPFKDGVYFTTDTDTSKKEFWNNTFSEGDLTFNRISYIFGANGSGKSNFCKAILQIQSLISISPLLSANNPQLLEFSPLKITTGDLDRHFLFEASSKDVPSDYMIEILMDGTTYTYSFSIKNGVVISEVLSKKKMRTTVILNRTSPNFNSIQLKSELSSFTPNISVVKERALCLSMAAFLNNPFASKLVDAINSISVVNMASLNGLRNISPDNFNENIRQKCLNFLRDVDPTLNDLSVEFTEEKVDTRKLPLEINDLEGRELIVKNVRVNVQSKHSVYDKDSIVDQIHLPFLKYESSGTIKILGILPIIFQALDSGSPVIIDELENGLHPTMLKLILGLFNSPQTNPMNAQLICTTHALALAENSVRRDQVWVISKDSHGCSSMKRISEYPGTRTTDNIAEKYLSNAFGSIPSFY